MPTNLELTFGGETLLLNANRTLYWPAAKTLFATDLHAGKIAHMRRHGLALPAGSLQTDLAVLTKAVQRHGARQLVFLGDLFHSETNHEWDEFADWCRRQPFVISLVRGNHDRFLSGQQLADANVAVSPEPLIMEPFELRHHPSPEPGSRPVLCGHLHPVYRLEAVGRDRLRLPCFWQQPGQLILPAIGSATGGYAVTPQPADKVFVCGGDSIIQVY